MKQIPDLSSLLVLLLFALFFVEISQAQPAEKHKLKYEMIPTSSDKAIPLGNGMLEALVWQKDGKLRISIERADLWDSRATIVFEISNLGPVETATLDIASAICTIKWKSGVIFRAYVDATVLMARYSWEGATPAPLLISSAYVANKVISVENQVVSDSNMYKPGYSQGKIVTRKNRTVYRQQCWQKLEYECAVNYTNTNAGNEGCYTISSHNSDKPRETHASKSVKSALKTSFDSGITGHKQWWLSYWNLSTVSLPDSLLEKQYYVEMYKFGAASRKGIPPITKNSFHHTGGQRKAGYNCNAYNPYAIEGISGFASGIQKMLLQNNNGIISIFPALPADWRNVSFDNLSTEGAFLVSARKENGVIDAFTIAAPEGGIARILLPFPTYYVGTSNKMERMESENNKELVLKFEKGGKAVIRNGYEY